MAKKKQPPPTYTYRGGKRISLKKRPDQFVVRSLPDELPQKMADAKQVSSASSRVTCAPKDLERLMDDAREMAPAHHAYEVADTGGDFLITDRIIVAFRQPPSVEDFGQFLAKYGLRVVEAYSPREYLLQLTDHTGMNPVKLVVKLTEQESDLLESVDHDLNMIAQTAAISLPTDPSYAQQWHLHRQLPAATDYDPRSSARCDEAWQLLDHFGSNDVVVGVTDDGCQLDHPDFDAAAPKKFAGWGYFEGTTLFREGDPGAIPAKMYQVGANHGTSCAGVIAAEVDAVMTVGAAPGCRLLPIKWESSGPSLFISDSKLRTALDYMADKVDVISNSWGIVPTSSWSSVTKNRIRQLAQTGGRRGRGIVFLWAAGNENCLISHVASQDVPFTNGWNSTGTTWIGVSTSRVFSNDLVGIPGVMHIAALASTAQRSHYSNYGTGIELCAPSSNSHRFRRLSLPGRGITTTRGQSTVTSQFGGTSSATPLVAGIAALVVSANSQLTALEVIGILKQTASKDLNMTPWPRTPSASFDPDTSWDVSPVAPFESGAFQNVNSLDGTWSPWFGCGRVDAVAAVRRAMELAGNRSSHVSATSTIELPIPDNNPVGVVSRMNIAEDGVIQSIKLSVDIAHTYIGDLVVRIVAPVGRRADLHRRSGASAHNLVKTYDELSTPELSTFRGAPIGGVWSLEITDLAAVDEGKLRQWKIEAEVLRDASVRQESTPGVTIPDDNTGGIADTLTIADPRTISDIFVELDITHTFIGDLRVELRGPDGITALLHDQTGGDTDNLRRTFRLSDTPALNPFVGRPAAGPWTLAAADLAARDIGKLNRWALSVR